MSFDLAAIKKRYIAKRDAKYHTGTDAVPGTKEYVAFLKEQGLYWLANEIFRRCAVEDMGFLIKEVERLSKYGPDVVPLGDYLATPEQDAELRAILDTDDDVWPYKCEDAAND